MGDCELRQEQLSALAVLLVTKKPGEMSEEELRQIMDAGDQLGAYLDNRVGRWFVVVRAQLNYRARKAELNKLSTEKLQRIWDDICRDRAAIIRADWDDDLPDSFYEAPPLDSDHHIIPEILEERRKTDSAAVSTD